MIPFVDIVIVNDVITAAVITRIRGILVVRVIDRIFNNIIIMGGGVCIAINVVDLVVIALINFT